MSEPERVRVTVVVLTLNEERRLERCLSAVPRSHPVLVLDSGSTDGTAEAARRAGAEVAVNPWPGFAAQRNHALRLCRETADWVLFIDSDEIFPAAFFEWMERTLNSADPGFDAALIPSRLVFRGRVLNHAPGYPVHHPRLVRTGGVRFVANHAGHGETVEDGVRIARCPVPYLHYFYDGGLAEWMRKHVGLAVLEAAAESGRGLGTRRAWVSRAAGRSVLRVPLRFLYHYVLRGGFRDGRAGFQYAAMYAWYEAAVWLLRTQAAEESGDEP